MGLTWQGAGGEITGEARADYYEESDFVPFLTKALETSPDVMLVGGPTEPTGMLVEQAKGLGYQGGFIVTDQAKIDLMAGQIGMDKTENCIGVAPVEAPFRGTREFAERYREKYDQPVSWETAICYTATWMLKRAMEYADDFTDPAVIRNAIPNALPMSGDEYPVELDGIERKGVLRMPTAITMVRNGEFTLADQLIYWWKTTD